MKTPALILAFVTSSFLLSPMAVQAQKKAPAAAQAASDDDAEEEEVTGQDYVDIMEAMFANMDSTADIFDELKDGASVKATVKKLNRLTAELEGLREELAELGVPTPQAKKEMESIKGLEEAGNKAGERLKSAMTELPDNAAELAVPLQEYGTTLAALGNDMQDLDAASNKKAGPAKPKKPTKADPNAGAADAYVDVLSAMLDVQYRVGDILAEVEDEETAQAAVRKIKRCTKEVAGIVAEFKALGPASAAANAAMEKNTEIPKRTKEVTAHITEGAKGLSADPALAKIVGPALSEFSETCQSISDPAEPEASETPTEFKAADYVELATEMITNMESGATTLESVKDEDTAKTATEKFAELNAEWASIEKRKAAMPKPTGALKAELDKNKTVEILGTKAQAHIEKAMKYIEEAELKGDKAVLDAFEKTAQAWLKSVGAMK